MLTQFRIQYPKGSLVTELLTIDHGKYIVRCWVQNEGTTLVTGMAAADTVELAEDQARIRALAVLGINATTVTKQPETSSIPQDVSLPMTSKAIAPTVFSDVPSVAKTHQSSSLEQPQPTQFPEKTPTVNQPSFSSFESKPEEVTNPVTTQPVVGDEMPFASEYDSAEVESFPEMETPHWTAETTNPAPLPDVPMKSHRKKKSQAETNAIPSTADTVEFSEVTAQPPTTEPIDLSEFIARTNVELKRLGWTNQQGRDYLVQTYGKRSRQLLTDDELLDFLHHLESEPSPQD